jgi:hypothetical protein
MNRDESHLRNASGIAMIVPHTNSTAYNANLESSRHIPPCNNCMKMLNEIANQGILSVTVAQNFSRNAW